MGHGSRGSWVSSLMGQMGHGPQNVTNCQLRALGYIGEPRSVAVYVIDNDAINCIIFIKTRNSSGDEIANVNFFPRHCTCRGQRLRPLNRLPNHYKVYMTMLAPTPTKPSYQSPLLNSLSLKWTRPSSPPYSTNSPARCYTRNTSGDRGVGNYRQQEAIA